MSKTQAVVKSFLVLVLVLVDLPMVLANGLYTFGPPDLPQDVPEPVALHLRTIPSLPIARIVGKHKGNVFQSIVGTTVQLHVEAEFADGSRRDVTQTKYTYYHGIDSGSTVIEQVGKVSFRRPEKLPYPSLKERLLDTTTIIVMYGRNVLNVMSFDIVPNSEAK